MLLQFLLVSAIFTAVHVSGVDCASEVLKARAYVFEAVKGGNPSKTIGIIDFTQVGTLVKLNGTVDGLKPGMHGFHVHEKGDLGNGCLAAAAHFNPYKMMHGAPDDSNRHVGDLGNIYTPASGSTIVSISDSVISLSGQNNVIGRAIVIHADPDDLGRGNTELSKTTGNAGARVACGVIGVSEEKEVIPLPEPFPPMNEAALEQSGKSSTCRHFYLTVFWVAVLIYSITY